MRVELRTIGDSEGSRFYGLRIYSSDGCVFRAFATADAPKSIASGTYRMVRDYTGKHRWWSIQHVEGRTFLEFHAGNWGLRDSDGCVLPGSAIQWMETAAGVEYLGVYDSTATLNEMKRVLGDGTHELTITEKE